MAENFYTMLTKIGKSKLSNSAVSGSKVNFKTLKVGDGKGAYYEPSENQTSLVKEVWSGNISSISVDDANSNWIVVETVIPATDGGFFIREAGIFDEAGDMIAISKLAETYKPVVSEGSTKDLVIKIVLEVLNVDSVTLKIDPNVVAATKNDVQILDSKIQEINSRVSELENSISNQNIITPTVNYGMNNVIKLTGENSVSPKFTMQGKAVINLLGKDGNCEDVSKWSNWQVTSALDSSNKVFGNNGMKITLTSAQGNSARQFPWDASKYYCVSAYVKNGTAPSVLIAKDSAGGGIFVGGTTYSDTTKFNRSFLKLKPGDAKITNNVSDNIIMYFGGSPSSGQYGYFDGIMVEEITQVQYNDSTFTPSPYVDSYAYLQNPYIEIRHDNLVRNGNGEEGTAWWIPSSSDAKLSIENGKFKLITTALGFAYVPIKVKKNTNYTIKANITSSDINTNVRVWSSDLSSSLFLGILISTDSYTTFNSGDNDTINVLLRNQVGATSYFDSIMLIEGTTAPTSYKPCRIERVVLETKLTSDDSITYDNGEVTGQIWWKHKTLFGKDYDWQFENDSAGYKTASLRGANLISYPDKSEIVIKYDGKLLSTKDDATNFTSNDLINSRTDNAVFLSISDTDTGWAESINPNADEVKAFMNGWKAYFNNGSRYLMWVNVLDLSKLPDGVPQTTTTSAGTNVSIIPVTDATKLATGSALCVWHPSGWFQVVNISSISGNNVTVATPVTFNSGATVGAVNDNGLTDTRILNYCKNNVAPNYEGYQLHYKLQNPEPITDDNCHIHGDIPKLDKGDNYLYLDSGIVFSEVANPQCHNASDYQYKINSNYYDGKTSSYLRNKTEIINSIFRNELWDSTKWLIKSQYEYSAYGNCGAYITASNFDTSATYTVDYKILATQSPQIGSIGCSYTQDIVTAINKLSEEVNNRQAHDSILDSIVDLSLYEKTTLLYDICPWYMYGSGMLIMEMLIPMNPKKTIPIITISNVKIFAGNSSGESDVTAKFILQGIRWTGNKIGLQYSTTDSSTISNIKSYGVEFASATITADCRGRV